jgi:2Fe-2S ferredoxin
MPTHNADHAIRITVLEAGMEHLLTTRANEYRNLMQLIHDQLYPDGFGECNGMGRCGTCLVKFLSSPSSLPESDRNETTTLKKIGITDDSIRLACQLQLNGELDGSLVKIV